MSVKSNPGRNGQQSPQEWGIQKILLALYRERPMGNNKTKVYTMWEVWNEVARKGSWTKKDTLKAIGGELYFLKAARKMPMFLPWHPRTCTKNEGKKVYIVLQSSGSGPETEPWVQICSIICASLTWGQGGIPALGDVGVITPHNPNSSILMLGDNRFTLLFTTSSFLSWRQSPRHKHNDFTDSLNRQALWLKDPVTPHSE